MRAIVFSSLGDSSVLKLVDREVPIPGPGQVRVKLAVAGVNPTDWKLRAGVTVSEMPLPEITPGQDGAGVIDEVGDGVSHLKVGDRVWVFLAQLDQAIGTATEFTVVPAERVVPLTDSASYDVGASLGVPAMTAHRCLTMHQELPQRLSPRALEDRVVLVTGGAGAVGHAAIQLANWAGATTVTTVSSEAKGRLAKAAGAHHVIDYTTGDTAAKVRDCVPQGVDLAVDVAIISNVDVLAEVLKPRGAVAAYANDGGATAAIPVRPLMVLNARLQFVLLYTAGQDALRAAAEDVSKALADGALDVGEEHGLPIRRFSLADTAAAHDAVEGGVVGKVLIDIANPDVAP